MSDDHVFRSISDIIRAYPPSKPQGTTQAILGSACEAISEFAPPGAQHLTERACKTLVGTEDDAAPKQPAIINQSAVSCITERQWFGAEHTYCVPKGGK